MGQGGEEDHGVVPWVRGRGGRVPWLWSGRKLIALMWSEGRTSRLEYHTSVVQLVQHGGTEKCVFSITPLS